MGGRSYRRVSLIKNTFSDEELVEESMKLFSENDDAKNLLELYLIDDYKKVLEAGN